MESVSRLFIITKIPKIPPGGAASRPPSMRILLFLCLALPVGAAEFSISSLGIAGYLSANGFEGAEDTPCIDHYFFPTRDRRIFCVCAYSAGDPGAAAKMREIVLGSLRYLDESPKEATNDDDPSS